MSEEEYATLRASIRKSGQWDPVRLFKGEILDGVGRNDACEELGLEVRTVEFKGTENDALDFVEAMADARRHLTASQRATMVAELRKLRPTKDVPPPIGTSSDRPTQAEEARAAKVSDRYVRDAERILEAAPEFGPAMKDRGLEVSVAKKLLGLPVAARKRIAEAEPKARAKLIKDAKAKAKAKPAKKPPEPAKEETIADVIAEGKAEAKAIVAMLREVRLRVERFCETKAGDGVSSMRNHWMPRITEAEHCIKAWAPKSVCPNCKGTKEFKGKKCGLCHKRGYLTGDWDTMENGRKKAR